MPRPWRSGATESGLRTSTSTSWWAASTHDLLSPTWPTTSPLSTATSEARL